MTISADSLRGYILEEVLAFLIRKTGYKLLVDPIQDERDLTRRGNGLAVQGRGGVHQVDVLGQLEWIPAFTFPLRLFVEAKFRKSKTGIAAVRNAIGVLLDINQNNSPIREDQIYPQRYHYAYALFSTSGFSRDAMDMALAHQISLIDLSGTDFDKLRREIDKAARTLHRRINPNDINEEGDESYREYSEDLHVDRGKIVSDLRDFLRRQMETMPKDIPVDIHDRRLFINIFEAVISIAKEYDELFVAMPNGPFMLVLNAENPVAFVKYAASYPRHKVDITWSRNIDNGQTWLLSPSRDRDAYRLSFKLPEIVRRWIFETSANVRDRAWQAKQDYFSTITVYRFHEGKDQLFRLEFDSESTRDRLAKFSSQR